MNVISQPLLDLARTENRFQSILSDEASDVDKVNDALMMGAIMHLHNSGFRWIEVPCITKITGACENVDTLYKLDHFGEDAYLAQTGQLYLEAKIPSNGKIWTIIPSSRAEYSIDNRHVNQFSLIEFEHLGDIELLLANIELLIQAMVRNTVEKAGDALKRLGRDMEHLQLYLEPFNRITYKEAVKLLNKSPHKVKFGDDLKAVHELYIVKELGNKPTLITHYPKEIKFFNMRTNKDSPDVVNSADLILPFSGEAVGSAERENDYSTLVERLKQSQMFKMLLLRGKTIDDFKDYLDIIKQHPELHSGCGVGFNRVSQSILGVADIRMACNYPIQRGALY